MGIFGSSEEKTEEKMVDSTGHVNNNIIIQEAKDTHHQMLLNEKLLMATYVLVFLEIIKLMMYSFCAYKKYLKRKYLKNKQTSNSTNRNV